MSDKKRLNKDYDAAFRVQAAQLVITQGASISKVADDLGIPASTLHGWVSKFLKGVWSLEASKPISATKLKLPSSSQRQRDRFSELERKNRDLEVQVRRLTQEREILKKAMVYCLDVPK